MNDVAGTKWGQWKQNLLLIGFSVIYDVFRWTGMYWRLLLWFSHNPWYLTDLHYGQGPAVSLPDK